MAGDLRGKLFTALTGSSADVSGKTTGGDVKGMLLAVGGASARTRSGIDLTKAADRLGLSRRTLERWVKTADTGQGQRPSPQHAKSLATKARQAATTKAGRKASLAQSGLRKAITARGARVYITCWQGPHAQGRDYMRSRTTMQELDPEAAGAMLDAWENGGEKGFMSWATQHWGEDDGSGAPGYLGDWRFSDDFSGKDDGILIQRPFGGKWQ